MKENDIVFVKADATTPNPIMEATLDKFEAGGIPFYLIIPGDQTSPMIVPNRVLGPGALLKHLKLAIQLGSPITTE